MPTSPMPVGLSRCSLRMTRSPVVRDRQMRCVVPGMRRAWRSRMRSVSEAGEAAVGCGSSVTVTVTSGRSLSSASAASLTRAASSRALDVVGRARVRCDERARSHSQGRRALKRHEPVSAGTRLLPRPHTRDQVANEIRTSRGGQLRCRRDRQLLYIDPPQAHLRGSGQVPRARALHGLTREQDRREDARLLVRDPFAARRHECRALGVGAGR